MSSVSTRRKGKQSKQDYGTPMPLILENERRYGRKIVFDLAADPLTKKHARYFAAPKLLVAPPRKDGDQSTCTLCNEKILYRFAGNDNAGLYHIDDGGFGQCKDLLDKNLDDDQKIWIPNEDKEAFALDALVQSWHLIPDIAGGLLWLNPPFADIEPWVCKCKEEARLMPPNTSILFLVPAAVGSVWFLENVFGLGDRNYLKPRVPFNGESYNKDCMIVEFHRDMSGRCFVWDWRAKKVYDERNQEVIIAA